MTFQKWQTYDQRTNTLFAEKQLLGAILIDSTFGNEAIDYCRLKLTPGDFLDSGYKDPDNQHHSPDGDGRCAAREAAQPVRAAVGVAA